MLRGNGRTRKVKENRNEEMEAKLYRAAVIETALVGTFGGEGTNVADAAGASPVDGLRRSLIAHARVLEDISPLSARATVAVLEVLPEVVGTIELFGLVAFAELVFLGEMLDAERPLGGQRELLPAVAAYVGEVGAMR
jgi:hypothetical protein